MSEFASIPSELQLQQALRVAIAATDRGDYDGAMKVFKAVYEDPSIKAPPDGLSAYGLCVAIADKQTKKGIDLCRDAIAAQFYDARHYINLINLHVKKGNKKAAVDVLGEALGKLPQDSALLAQREKLGIVAPPPIRFLSHRNLLNRILIGRKKGGSRGLRPGRLHPMVKGLIVLIVFGLIFGGTFFVLYRQAYG